VRQSTAAAVLVTISLSCVQSASRHEPAPSGASPQSDSRSSPNIDHLTPARDSIGSSPSRFVWTKIDGADSYSIGVWNEVDMLVWRQNNIATTSVTVPEDVRLEPGTYFWSVSALHEGQQVAESGLAAFVVRTSP
jgi:hypothetical protein